MISNKNKSSDKKETIKSVEHAQMMDDDDADDCDDADDDVADYDEGKVELVVVALHYP